MPDPVTVDIPHQHSRAEVRSRLDKGIGQLAGMIPGGGAVEHRWEGDTMHFVAQGMGQRVACRMEVLDDKVHAEIDLPPFLALFADKIRAKLAKEGPKLLG